MKEYFVGIIAITFLGGIMIMLSPQGYTKHLRLLCGLCSAALILLPLFSFVSGGGGAIEDIADIFSQEEYQKEYYEEIYNGSLLLSEKENAEKILKAEIKRAVSTNNDNFDVNIVIDKNSDEIYIRSVEIIIRASGVSIDPRSVEKYIKETLGCECVIIYDL